MDATSPRWTQVTPSQHSWEADALDALRSLLPDADPFRVWTNFEFTDGGRIHEADALAVTPKGVFLIEIKSWSGRVHGDQGSWVQERRDGTRLAYGNPARLNTAKVRSLASLIKRNWRGGPTAPRTPYIESLVWFSNPNLRVALPSELRGQVAVADDNEQARGHIQTLTQAIIDIGEAESSRTGFRRITAEQSDEFAAAMARIGFKESTRTRTAGSFILQLPAFAERGSTQDFTAKHKLHGLPARVRIYSTVVGATPEEAKALREAASREFMATQNLRIDGVVHATDLDVTEFGPAVVFEHHPNAIRLDRFLAERSDELDTDARLRIMEQITSTVREMHRRRISHRMLTPESVWLRPAHRSGDAAGTSTGWEPLISDFSLAARESADGPGTVATYTRVGSLPIARTGAAEVVLGDPTMETYLAPEAFTDSDPDGVSLDAFSIGALTYLLFTGQAPAPERSEMRTALGTKGLSISAVLPEIDPRIEELVRGCTNPIVSKRSTSMAEILDQLALARGDASQGSEAETDVDPLVAEGGQVLGGRFEVKRRLGKGSTAVALWCHDRVHDRDVVLKVASKPANDDRLEREGEAITNLKHENVVELHEQLTIAGRKVLVLSFAGERSLAGYVRIEGPVSTEFLRRWGQDLLEAVRYLEKVGVAHRDVKPDNLGIVEMGPRKESHLVLFDFSLAGTSAEDLTAGTPGYLDPFLSDDARPGFDLAAERYAVAVTIHEMATGETPTWGDGRSDPAYLPNDVQPTLLVEAIDPEVRTPVVEFLTRALQRDPDRRFDTADDMARAWLAVFTDWEQNTGADGDYSGDADDTPTVMRLPENLSLDDPIASLPTSRKVRSALRKVGAETIRGVASLDALTVNKSRGVAVKTRKQVLRLRAAVLEHFADDLAAGTTTTSTRGPTTQPAAPPLDTAGQAVIAEPETKGDSIPGSSTPVGSSLADIDQLGTLLVPPRGKRGPAGSVSDTVRGLLGIGQTSNDESPDVDWPTVTTVAEQVGVTKGAASQSFQKARAHWSASPDLMGVGTDLLAIVADLSGVAGVSELTGPLVDARGSGHPPEDASRLAAAVVRAVLESGSPVARLFTLRRSGARTIVAVDGAAIDEALRSTDDDTAPAAESLAAVDASVRRRLAGIDAAAMTELAVQLGQRADELVRSDVLVPSGDALSELRTVHPGAGRSLSDARLLRLAGASSDTATTNATSDLVRRTASPVDALRWSRAALVSATRLTVDEVVARVAPRFPGTTLPLRPELDDALAHAELKFEWSDQHQAYQSTEAGPGGVGPLTRVTTRQHTVVGTGGTTVAPPPDTIDPAIAGAIEVEERLDRSLAEGGFLALRVPTDRLAQAQRGLARFQTGHPPMVSIDLEATFLRHLRAESDKRKVAWANLEGADDPTDPNWAKLSILAASAVDATIAEVAGHRHVIAWYPGALVRHTSTAQAAPLDRLRDAVLDSEHELRSLWLVVLASTADALPKVDGTPVPALAASQWMDLSDTWLKNTHRAGGLTA
ncbi:MAG: BREX system serine/threonine kinase PglW [Acidimicrobiales bacterium]